MGRKWPNTGLAGCSVYHIIFDLNGICFSLSPCGCHVDQLAVESSDTQQYVLSIYVSEDIYRHKNKLEKISILSRHIFD